jgi:hypothetical protein
VKIKFGPVALVYDGSTRYVERDIDASRLVLQTQGEDRRGNGTATATTTLIFAENGEQTDIEVSAELELTGKPAQFGEEVIADTLSKLLDQFLSCVAGRFAEGLGDPAEEDEFGEDDPEDESDTEQTVEFEAVPGSVASEPVPEPAPATAGPTTAATETPATEPAAPGAPAAPATGPYRYTPPKDTSQPDVKVVATVGSVMIKRYGPALGVLSLVVVVAVKIISWLRRR